MVLGANTFREFTELLGSVADSELDPISSRMKHLPTTVLSTTLEEPLDWPEATLVRGDAVEVVARLKEKSGVPLRSHRSLSVNRALMAAGLVDRVQITIFPIISGRTGTQPGSEVRPTSTSSCWTAGRSTAASRNSFTAPPCTEGNNGRPHLPPGADSSPPTSPWCTQRVARSVVGMNTISPVPVMTGPATPRLICLLRRSSRP